MTRPGASQLAKAKRMLALEGASGDAAANTAAVGRVYDKLHVHLDPLLGAAGVHALLVRSAKLTQGPFSFLETETPDLSTALRERLLAQDPAVVTESAAALFATFLGLITTFIGDRLTIQVLRRAWPTLEAAAPTERTE